LQKDGTNLYNSKLEFSWLEVKTEQTGDGDQKNRS
jgi:hypothetical protein